MHPQYHACPALKTPLKGISDDILLRYQALNNSSSINHPLLTILAVVLKRAVPDLQKKPAKHLPIKNQTVVLVIAQSLARTRPVTEAARYEKMQEPFLKYHYL